MSNSIEVSRPSFTKRREPRNAYPLEIKHQPQARGGQGRGLHSSDAAAVLGLDPYHSPLDIWHQKVGMLIQQDGSLDREVVPSNWAAVVEPLVANVYSKRTGNPVTRVDRWLEHPTHPWMVAATRWDVLAPEVRRLQCLEVRPEEASLWAAGVPEYVRVDAMHLLAVTGLRAVDIAVLADWRSVRILRIERDEALIERLIEEEARFWAYVGSGKPPPPSSAGRRGANRGCSNSLTTTL